MSRTSRRYLTLISVMVLLAGCNESDKQQPDDDFARRGPALVAVMQCFIDHRLIPDSELQGRSWLVDGKIQPNPGFSAWTATHRDTVYQGRTLDTWENEATAAWPNWKCPL
ncbi:hypothetical protein [Sphaerisporangium fuscum]|uniref:hypothetical protein n=1 Tax=Sphaerisporangium fuscum TaxID=2835868 RepID=UPI001BDC8993|nr:hypothetical protein [Sphaerisporangium fuscum]